ncbi:MAG TPA: hypothetical protein VE843_08825, partial [Ktedonobacteraceae bacterium]|nr:hypothetical protein [Ktedonobacteraceae bacterium]
GRMSHDLDGSAGADWLSAFLREVSDAIRLTDEQLKNRRTQRVSSLNNKGFAEDDDSHVPRR